MAQNEAKIQFKAETAAFDSAIKSSNDNLSSLRAELKLNEAQFKNTGDEAEYLSQKSQLLEAELQANAEKQEALNSKIEVATQLFGEDSEEVQKLETSLTYAKIQEENIKSAIDSTNTSMEGQSASSQEAASALDKIASVETVSFLKDLTSTAMDAMTSMYDLADASSEYTDRIDKMSQKLGIGREAFQEWDYIMSLNGSSIDGMKSGMKKLQSAMEDITSEADFSKSAFADLGISYQEFTTMNKEDIFSATIAGLQGITDDTEKAARASEVFGKSYQELAPLLNSSASATEELKQKAKEMGLVLGDDLVDQGVEFHDTMDTLNRTIEATKTAIGAGLEPVISGMVEVIQPIVPIVQNVALAVNDFVKTHPAVQAAITGITVGLLALTAALAIVTVIQTVKTAFIALNATMLANPAVWIAAAIIGLGAALIYAYKHSEKFRAVVQAGFSKVKTIVKSVVTVFNAMKASLGAVVTDIKSKFDSIVKKVTEIVKKVKGFFPITVGNLLKGLKLPHFTLKGKFSLEKSTVPTVGVTYHASNVNNPTILTRATAFAIGNNGRIHVAGETEPEMVGGVRTVGGMITSAVEAANTINEDRLAMKIAQACAGITQIMELNHREVGRIIKEYR